MKSGEKIIYHTIRIIIAVTFIYASIDKIIHPQAFAQAVFNHQILPDSLINLTAIVLPWMELVLGLCLLFNIWTAGASTMAAGLMALFISIISFNLMRGLDVECGCFSATASESMSALTLIRDLVFLLLSIGFAGLAMKQYHRNFAKE